MADPNSPFVSTSLSPQRIGGNSKFYELTSASVTPTSTYVDADGNVVEERIPVHYSTKWVGVDGCVKDVPMRTSAVFSMEPAHAGYEQIMTKDMIEGGQLPLAACPWTHKYSFITGGTLARSKEPGEDCGGKPSGCEHMHKVIVARKATSLKKHEEKERHDNAKSEKQILQMAKTIGVVMSDMESARAPAPPKMK
jgi:hypothetical protein